MAKKTTKRGSGGAGRSKPRGTKKKTSAKKRGLATLSKKQQAIFTALIRGSPTDEAE